MNPGSPEAIDAGCTCPRMDNANGRGIPTRYGTLFYYASNCPLHNHGDFPGGKEPIARNGKGEGG